MPCPLCHNTTPQPIVAGKDHRSYWLCPQCSLIFVDSKWLPSASKERARYEQHENKIRDKGYLRFLNQLVRPATPYLQTAMQGLDYGTGPTPALAHLLQEKGFSCDNYDPLFEYPPLTPPYDFIFASECFEHFHQPKQTISEITQMLKPGGYLFVMTSLWHSLKQFKTWYYKRDFTHVCFYHENSMTYIAKTYGFETLRVINQKIMLLQKA